MSCIKKEKTMKYIINPNSLTALKYYIITLNGREIAYSDSWVLALKVCERLNERVK